MDSLSQLVLGAAVAGAIAPAQHRRAALLAGAALGTLPDLDALFLLAADVDPVTLMTVHRSFSHSLFVLPVIATVIWWLSKKRGGRVAQAPARWFWSILLALMTHPLLDAFTVYGTQLWWPIPVNPTMWSSVFIIDPLYTLGLLGGCLIAWFYRERPVASYALWAGLIVSSGYLGGSLLAKHRVEEAAQTTLMELGLADAPRFSVPLPLNTVLWRVIVMTPEGYLIGDRSLIADRGPMVFHAFVSDVRELDEVSAFPSVKRLRWFNRGFMRAERFENQLVLSDLRMGLEPEYNFNFVVAVIDDGHWQPISPRQLSAAYRSPVAPRQLVPALRRLLWRMTHRSDDLLRLPPDNESGGKVDMSGDG